MLEGKFLHQIYKYNIQLKLGSLIIHLEPSTSYKKPSLAAKHFWSKNVPDYIISDLLQIFKKFDSYCLECLFYFQIFPIRACLFSANLVHFTFERRKYKICLSN